MSMPAVERLFEQAGRDGVAAQCPKCRREILFAQRAARLREALTTPAAEDHEPE